MKNGKISLLGTACIGYFALLQTINLSTLNSSADTEAATTSKTSCELVPIEDAESAESKVSQSIPVALSSNPILVNENVESRVRLACWAVSNVSVYSEPNMAGAVIGSYAYGDEILYSEYSDEWLEVDTGYVRIQDISLYEPMYRSVSVPTYKDFKSYMDYRTIGAWLQQDLQDIAETGTHGCRMYDGRYLVAVGTACDVIVGDYIDVVLENGTIIEAIVGDIKADIHTEENNLITKANGCATEFIVDMDAMDSKVKRSGSLSNAQGDWKSRVVEIRVLGNGLFR